MLGNFATKTLSDMSLEELRDFARILEQNDADIYDWLTNKSPLPTDLRSNIMTKLLEFYNLNNA